MIEGYHFIETLVHEEDFMIYRAVDEQTSHSVLIKMSTLYQTSKAQQEMLEQTVYISKLLPDESTLNFKLYYEKSARRKPYLMAPDVRAIPLDFYIKRGLLLNIDFLTITKEIAGILAQLHQHRYVYQSITPSSIMIFPQSKKMIFTNFCFSIKESTLVVEQSIQPIIKRMAPYLSPEQTGRVGRLVDTRSDFYSLGILLYQWLTGRLPFITEDDMEWIHAHISKKPLPPHELNKEVPKVFSMMVMKLLEKNPDNRYQSAFGLIRDCERLEKEQAILLNNQPFILGSEDQPTNLIFSNHLYGYEEKVIRLQNCFRRVKDGETEVVLIEGESGTGKTALLERAFQPFIKEAYFIQGVYEKRNAHQPYHGLINGFARFVDGILASGTEEVNKWTRIFIEELGDSLHTIGRIFSDIYLIVDETEQRIKITEETESRITFKQAVHSLLTCLAGQGKPVVFSIDDIQWMDQASYQLFKDEQSFYHQANILFIYAYQTDHNTETVVKEDVRQGLFMNRTVDLIVNLSSFSKKQIEPWIGQSFHLEEKMSTEVVNELFEATKGNQLFLQQTIKNLYKKEQFVFNQLSGHWTFVNPIIEPIKRKGNDKFIYKKLSRLSTQVEDILNYCACIGYQFKSDILYEALSIPKSIIDYSIQQLQAAGIIKMVEMEFDFYQVIRFVEEDTWQTFYDHLSAHIKAQNHFRIGQTLLNNRTQRQVHSTIIDHFNKCFSLSLSEKTKKEMAEYNLILGVRYMESDAHYSANAYFAYGLKWLEGDESSHLSFQLLLGKARCLYAVAQNTKAQDLTKELYEKATSIKEKIDVLTIEIKMTNHLVDPEKVINLALEGLSLLGYSFPKKMIGFHVLKELVTVRLKMRRIEKQKEELPTEYSEREKMTFSMLEAMGIAVYGYKRELYALHILKLMKSQYPSFNHANSSLILSQYAMVLSEGLNDFSEAYKVSKWANERVGHKADSFTKGVTHFIFSGFIQHWDEPLQNKIASLQSSFEMNKKAGNLVVAGGCLILSFNTLLMIGLPVQTLLKYVEDFRHKAQLLRLEEFIEYFDLVEKIMETLADLQVARERRKEIEAVYKRLKMQFKSRETTLSYFSLLMTFYWTVTKEYENCLKEVKESQFLFVDRNSVLGSAQCEYWVYHSLSICLSEELTKAERKAYVATIRSYLKKIKKWKKQNAANFASRYFIIEGCYHLLKQSHEKAIHSFKQSAKLTKEQNCIHQEALIKQVLSMIYLEKGKQALGHKYLQQANNNFQFWGAEFVVELNRQSFHIKKPETITENSFMVGSIDTISLMKASQVLSQEIVLEKVLQQLMKIVLEYAGAVTGVLILSKDNQLYIEVRGEMKQDITTIEVVQSIPVYSYGKVPTTLIDYVVKLRKAIIFENLTKDTRFNNDKYIEEQKPKSVLISPITHHKKLMGVLYLENNLSTHAFTKQDISVLSLLMNQAAISIENAHLYKEMQVLNESLEEKVKSRTYYLEKTQKEMAQTLATKSVLEERNRIARDIHDVVGHTLTTAIVQAEASRRLYHKNEKLSIEKLELSQQLIRKGLNEIRRSVKLLNQFDTEEEIDFANEINKIIQETELSTGVIIDSQIDINEPIPSVEMKKMIVLALKEAFTNGLKHGNCTRLYVLLQQTGKQLYLKIVDNGKGAEQVEFGFGLHSMRERVRKLEGEMVVASTAGIGTSIEIRVNNMERIEV
ncbi:AAA family ATPase [Alkalihalobacillus sp. 1P02AB]|uniref:AAA family ATPase n=1 Tax=Alkalihalobacillus sp. 1P02AB TaxID=3132260 RepID=UPI0039A4CAFF